MSLDFKAVQNISTDKIGLFRFKKFIDDTYLITNDAGKFHYFSTDDFLKFISGDIEGLSEYSELVKKGFIKSETYQTWMKQAYAGKTHYIGVGPSLHMMVMTLRCNHKCRYCHAAVAPMTAIQFDMSLETATKCVDAILHSNSNILTIEFQGGEALINWEVLQHVVEYGAVRAEYLGKNLSFSLVTNLTLMTEEKLQWLLDNQVTISTSLDGDKLNHNGNRTGYDGDSFERVTYWIQRINELKTQRGENTIGALLTVTKKNLPHYKEIIDAYLDLGLNNIFLRWLNPYGFAAADIEALAYESEEWIDFYIKSMDYIIELNKNGVDFREQITTVYLMKIFSQLDPGFMDIRNPSGIAIGGVAYNYDGKIYASDESRMLGRMGIDDFYMTDVTDDGGETYRNMMKSDVTELAIRSSTLDGLPGYSDHVYKPYLGVDIIHNFKTEGNLYIPMEKDEKMKLQVAILDYIFEKMYSDPEVYTIFRRWAS